MKAILRAMENLYLNSEGVGNTIILDQYLQYLETVIEERNWDADQKMLLLDYCRQAVARKQQRS